MHTVLVKAEPTRIAQMADCSLYARPGHRSIASHADASNFHPQIMGPEALLRAKIKQKRHR